MNINILLIILLLLFPFPISVIMTKKLAVILPKNMLWRKFVFNTFLLSVSLSIFIELILLLEYFSGKLYGESLMILHGWHVFSMFYIGLCVIISTFIGPVVIYYIKLKVVDSSTIKKYDENGD